MSQVSYLCGDNFVIKGMRHEALRILHQLQSHILAKNGALGPGPSHSDASGILLRWSVPAANQRDAIEIEADQTHSDLDLNQLNLEKTNTPVVSHMTPQILEHSSKQIISITLRENQLSVGGPSIAQTCL